MEIRCDGTMHGIVDPEMRTLEVKCHHSRCGYERGLLVLHTFDLDTGKMISTRRFRNPPSTMKGT